MSAKRCSPAPSHFCPDTPRGEGAAVHIAQAVGEAMFDWDIAAGHLTWCGATEAVFPGMDAATLSAADSYAALLAPGDRQKRDSVLQTPISRDQGAGVPYQIEYALTIGEPPVLVEETGRWFADDAGRPARVLGSVRAITARHAFEERLVRMARCDSLTGGLNRSYLVEALAEALEEAAKLRKSFGFIVVAIDHLARLNDAFVF